ncbi:uncharacterized protein LOC110978395 [Acanthaster planci]|uniref:Uncharacterized protein LOC110978395 n=1 Tax=Acanthaster planci TaxID=133434 RepID=A0A8B7YBI1_ACAPL|nr:uncharacterized protein LOC110978395 [Acanthaster planci]XP_022089056.1 uncharacterized protein LOC110978395 [Acanthaster planci]
MSAVAKSESLVHRDARLYCRRRHQKTMGKCAREERQSDALLARKLRHIQKSKAYREKELDREQEKCLTDLVAIFDRQCQIATTRLARRLKDALGETDIVELEDLWGKKTNDRQVAKGMRDDQAGTHRSLFCGKDRHSFARHSHVFTSADASPHKQFRNGYRLSNTGMSRMNDLSKDNRIRPDSPIPWQQKKDPMGREPIPNLNQHHLFKTHLGIHDSVQIPKANGGVAKRPTSSQPSAARPKTVPQIGENSLSANSRWDELASQVRCPQHGNNAPAYISRARSLRCLLRDCTDKTATPVFDAPEDVCFRRQYMACVMSRKLPVSGLRSGSFAQQDDVRKKMEARRKCMEELHMTSGQRAKSAPAGLVRICNNDLSAQWNI